MHEPTRHAGMCEVQLITRMLTRFSTEIIDVSVWTSLVSQLSVCGSNQQYFLKYPWANVNNELVEKIMKLVSVKQLWQFILSDTEVYTPSFCKYVTIHLFIQTKRWIVLLSSSHDVTWQMTRVGKTRWVRKNKTIGLPHKQTHRLKQIRQSFNRNKNTLIRLYPSHDSIFPPKTYPHLHHLPFPFLSPSLNPLILPSCPSLAIIIPSNSTHIPSSIPHLSVFPPPPLPVIQSLRPTISRYTSRSPICRCKVFAGPLED